MSNVHQGELVRQIADRAEISRADAASALDAALNIIQETAVLGGKVTLPGFGTFAQRDTAAREVRNPATGETSFKAASRRPVFKAGSRFRAAVAGETVMQAGGAR